jgi:hypothetical protein
MKNGHNYLKNNFKYMNAKPIITIDKFAGMGQNGILFCEGLYPAVNNQKSVMSEGFYPSKIFDYNTTGFSNLESSSIYKTLSLPAIYDSDYFYNLGMTRGGRFYIYHGGVGDVENGEIHYDSNGLLTTAPDIIETSLGNILYSSTRYIGRGIRGEATGGSTTTLVDTTRNFTTLGIEAGDKVTNLKTGIEYTITSITTTTNTNDTLNFDANGSNTNANNNDYIVWEDDRFDTNLANAVWQPDQASWVKQMRQYGTQYLFCNGNYIGAISADESTVDETYKQLPAKHQALAMDTNNEKILVSADFNGQGVLLLWDGSSNGWNNILNVDKPITALVSYKHGWIYVSSGTVYFTDGYQTQRIYSLNTDNKGSNNSIEPVGHNALVLYEDMLYIATQDDDLNFNQRGVYALDLNNPNNGFTLIRIDDEGRLNAYPFSLALTSDSFSGRRTLEVSSTGTVSRVRHGTTGGTYYDKSMIIGIVLPEPIKITGIGLNLSRFIKTYSNDSTTQKTRQVQVSIGDGKRGLISIAQGTLPTTTSSVITTSTWRNNEVGDQIYIRDNDRYFGERTFITAISGNDFTLSPALSGTYDGTVNFRIIRVKKLDKLTVSDDELSEEVMFYNPNTGILSNKIYVEIVLFGQSNALLLDINEIKIYGG